MKTMLASAARSPVFANLLMVFLIAAGVGATYGIVREMFPQFSFDTVVIRTVYPGATPSEVEEAVTIKVEEAVRGEDGVRKVESVSAESVSTVTVEVDSEVADPREVLVDIRNEIDRITTFPEDVDDPIVELNLNRREVMTLVLHGDVSEETIALLARDVEEELLLLPEVSEVAVSGLRPYEISISVRERDLQRYGLSFPQVAAAVQAASLDLPLGKLRSATEERLLKIESRRLTGREFHDVPVVTRPDGTRVLLHQVASIEDGFDEDEERVRIEGEPGVTISVQRNANEDTIRVAEAVEAWLAARQATLPPTITLAEWRDGSQAVRDRLSLLANNGAQGLFLVFTILLFFLGIRLSFWVAVGLPVAFLTAMVLLQAFGGSLNMISSFALIMILGILVDDSIVVGENIARHMREGGYTVSSAIRGLEEVTWPVIASVTTTAVAFLPLMFIDGVMGKFISIMPIAVIACLIASLIECLLILPAHLAHGRAPDESGDGKSLPARARTAIDRMTESFIQNRYGRTVDWALRNRYVTFTIATCFLILVAGLVASGRPQFIFFPRLDSEFIEAQVTMPQGTAIEGTAAATARVEAAARELRELLPLAHDGEPIARRIMTHVGSGGVHNGKVVLELALSGDRDMKSIEILGRWRELTGSIPAARTVRFSGTTHGPGGKPIELRILSDTPEAGERAALALKEELATFPGVFNVDDNLEPGKRELRFELTDAARALGVDLAGLAGQLYSGFSGREVDEIQRGREEVEVRVRYAPEERERLDQLGDMRVRAGDDVLLPLSWAAQMEHGRSLSRIERRDGRRVSTITAEVDDDVTNANEVILALEQGKIPELTSTIPGVEFDLGGQQEEQRETMTSLLSGFVIAMLGIYAILALLFGSYVQPVIVMMVIPVGFAGAILGHIVLGSPLMIFSVFGMVGLTGIVVNDALVLIDFVNRRRREGMSAFEAAAQAGRVRFRAVFLTTVTTVAGLLPILLETSLQAQFIIPMAISIASGVCVATVLTLYVVPCIYLMVEDFREFFVENPRPPGLLHED